MSVLSPYLLHQQTQNETFRRGFSENRNIRAESESNVESESFPDEKVREKILEFAERGFAD